MAFSVSSGNNFHYAGLPGLSFAPGAASLFVWASHNSIANAAAAFFLNEFTGTSTERSASLYFRGDTGGDPVQFRWVSPTGQASVPNSATGYSAGVPVNIGGRANAASGSAVASVFKDGSKVDGSLIGSAIQSFSVTRINIGCGRTSFDTGNQEPITGDCAKVAFWTALLTDEEFASLAKGFSPRRIRPQSLAVYCPMIRDVRELRRGLPFTQSGAPTVSVHPRSYGI